MNMEVKREVRAKIVHLGDTSTCMVFKVSGLGDMG